jgi:hypothetical protein
MAHAVIAGRHRSECGTNIGEVGQTVSHRPSSDAQVPAQQAISSKSFKTHADPKGADSRNRTYPEKFARRVNIAPLHRLTGMRRHSRHTAATGTLATLGILGAFIAGCSSGSDGGPTASSSQATVTSETSATSKTSDTPTAAPGSVAVSPGGVTTAVGAPADSTEDEYFKACQTAREWMQRQGGDAKSQLEPYLRSVQSTDASSPGTFGTPWSKLSPERQAAVIVAAQAAADALCG